MVVEQPEDAWYCDSGAVFTLGQLAGMRLTVAQRMVSWSESNESATATSAPPGHACGFRLRPARTRSTYPRQRDSSQAHG